MKAVVACGPGDFRLREVEHPRLEAGALVEVEAAGVCAADRMLWRGDGPWDLDWPFTPGHELLGRVLEIDPHSAQRWSVAVGDRVTAEVMVPCGACASCASGRTNLCRRGVHLGSGIPGAFADRLVLPPGALVHRIPDELDTAAGALVEPTACAVHAVRRAGIGPDDVVAIAGIGAIGAIALAVAGGCGSRLVAVTRSPERAALARSLGADEVVDVSAGGSSASDTSASDTSASDTPAGDAAEVLRQFGDGRGVDVFLDFSGSTEAVELGLESVAAGGRLVLYGVYRQRARIDLNLIAEHKELDVRGGHLAPGAFPAAIALLASGAVDASRIVTHRHRLEDLYAALEPPAAGDLRLKAIVVAGAAA